MIKLITRISVAMSNIITKWKFVFLQITWQSLLLFLLFFFVFSYRQNVVEVGKAEFDVSYLTDRILRTRELRFFPG